MRNSVHSNGTYIDNDGNDIQINWKGVDYRFTHLQPVDFMTYELMLELYGALIDSIEGIVAHPSSRRQPSCQTDSLNDALRFTASSRRSGPRWASNFVLEPSRPSLVLICRRGARLSASVRPLGGGYLWRDGSRRIKSFC